MKKIDKIKFTKETKEKHSAIRIRASNATTDNRQPTTDSHIEILSVKRSEVTTYLLSTKSFKSLNTSIRHSMNNK